MENRYIERNVVEPKGIVQVFRDHYWWCVDGDPKRALFFSPNKRGDGSPQCNCVQAIAQSIGESLGHVNTAKLVFISLAFVPWEG